MKTIIQENHYQKKLWDEACLEHELKSGKLDALMGDKEEREKRRADSLEKAKRKLQEDETLQHVVPSLIGRTKFKLATRYAVSLARYHQMNVVVKESDSLGIVELVGDEIMYDTVWRDGNKKQHLLLLLQLANCVCVKNCAEEDADEMSIWAAYRLQHRFHWNPLFWIKNK